MTRTVILLALAVTSCGTIASPAGGDVDLPNAKAGPFRLLRSGELDPSQSGPPAPFLARSEQHRYRDPSALDIDGDPSTLPIWLYAVRGDDDASSIVRFSAEDGRSVARVPETVLEASEDWEGGWVAAPSALRVSGEVWLYYASAGGIGLAKSKDGKAFVKEPKAVIADSLGCGRAHAPTAAPSEASVIRLPDGSFRMFFSVGDSICETSSEDGVRWRFAGDYGLVLRFTSPLPGDDDPFDSASIAHPFATTALSPEGRLIVRVYYVGRDTKGAQAIGLAARYGGDGPLVRAKVPVLRSDLLPGKPSVLAFDDFSLLYFTQQAGDSPSYPALAAAVAPATLSLRDR